MSNSPLRRSGMARVNEGSHNFTRHPRVYPKWNEPYLPLLPSRRVVIELTTIHAVDRPVALYIILNAVRCPYVRTYVRTSVTVGVASSVANDVTMRMTSQ